MIKNKSKPKKQNKDFILMSKETKAIVFGFQQRAIQR
ncbi:unnamed protein product, partial [marine sediment metagenome]